MARPDKDRGFQYLLEGSVVTQVEGGKEVTVTRSQTWCEGSNDIHVVDRNVSNTKPAKFPTFSS